MTDIKPKEIYPVPELFSKNAYIGSYDEYKQLYRESIEDPDFFWGPILLKITLPGLKNGRKYRTITMVAMPTIFISGGSPMPS